MHIYVNPFGVRDGLSRARSVAEAADWHLFGGDYHGCSCGVYVPADARAEDVDAALALLRSEGLEPRLGPVRDAYLTECEGSGIRPLSPEGRKLQRDILTAFVPWHCSACNRTVTHGGYHDCKGGTMPDPLLA